MASKIVSLILQAKNKLSPKVDEASKSLTRAQKRAGELERELAKLESAKQAAKGLEQASAAAEQTEQAFDAAQAEVIRLRTALKTGKTPELALALEKARIAAADAKKEWAASRKTVSTFEKSLKRAGVETTDLAAAQKALNDSALRLQGSLNANKSRQDALRKSTAAYSEECKKATTRVGSLASSLAQFIGVYAVVNKASDAIRGLARHVFDTGVQFETLGKRLSEADLGFIEEFARETPLQLEGVAAAFARLRTFGIDPTNGSLQALTDANAQMGGSQSDLEGIVGAVGQAWSKQKLQQEEVLQLVERGIPAWDLLADATGKSVPELQRLSSAGQLGRKEIELLIDAIGGANAGAAQAQMQTMAGLVSNLQDRFTQFYRMVADAGVWDYLKGELKSVSDWFDQMARSGQLQALAKQISNAFISSAEYVKSFARTVYEARDSLLLLAKAVAAVKLAGLAKGVVSATGGLIKMTRGAKGASGAMGLLSKAGSGAVSLLGKLSLAGSGVVAALGYVIKKSFDLVGAFGQLGDAQSQLARVNNELIQSNQLLAGRFAEISNATGVAVSSMAELDRQIAAGNIVIDKMTGRYLSAEQAAALLAKRQAEAAAEAAKAKISADALSASYQRVGDGLGQAAADNSKLASVMGGELLAALKGGVEGVGGFALALKSAEQQGKLTQEQIENGLSVALQGLSDNEKVRFKQLLVNAMDQVGRATDKAGLRVENLQGLMDSFDAASVESAFKTLGVVSDQVLDKTAEKAKSAFETINASGASVDKVKEAFLSYAKTAIAANEGIISTELRLQAIRLGLNTELQELVDVQQDAGDAGEDAGERIGAGADKAAESTKGVSEASKDVEHDVQKMAAGLAAFFQGIKSEMYELSDAAGAAFDNKLGIEVQPILDDIESLRAGIDAAHVEMGTLARDNLKVFDVTGINRFENAVLATQNEVEIAYNSQKVKFLEYMEAIESGEGINESFLRSANNSINSMNLLGSEDLSQLRSALDSANQKLAQMSDAAANTLGGLQDELDRLQGNQNSIDQREYERRRSELNAALEEARMYGNQEAIAYYTEALQVLDQVKREQTNQRREEERAAASNNATSSSSNSASSNTTRIEFQLPSGREIEFQGNQSDADALASELAELSGRS